MSPPPPEAASPNARTPPTSNLPESRIGRVGQPKEGRRPCGSYSFANTIGSTMRTSFSPEDSPRRRNLLTTSFAVIISASLCCQNLVAQNILRVDSRVACMRCEVKRELLADIKDSAESGFFGSFMSLTMDSRGRLYGTDLNVDPWRIRVFDRSGKLLRVIGKQGAGPGEHQAVFPPVFGPGDTMFVLDPRLLRITALSPSYTFIRSLQSPGFIDQWLVTRDGRFVLTATIGSAARAGWPVHLMNSQGQIVHSFGTDVPRLDPQRRIESRRKLAASSDGGVWTSRVERYFLERWTLDGKRTAALQRDASWFVVDSDYKGPASVVPPPSRVHAIWEDKNGRVWIAILVADQNWKRTNARAQEGDMIPMPRAQNGAIYDTIIEVIDIDAGRLVSSVRFPDYMLTAGSGQPFVSYHEDVVGRPSYKVWRFTLHERR